MQCAAKEMELVDKQEELDQMVKGREIETLRQQFQDKVYFQSNCCYKLH